jgi:hypothetical protein
MSIPSSGLEDLMKKLNTWRKNRTSKERHGGKILGILECLEASDGYSQSRYSKNNIAP